MALLSREARIASHDAVSQMKTAAGQCCFYPVPERDAQGIGRHYAVRTFETLCDNWLVLHKARSGLATVSLWSGCAHVLKSSSKCIGRS